MGGSEPNQRLEVGQEAAEEVVLCAYHGNVAADEVEEDLWDFPRGFSEGILRRCIEKQHLRLHLLPRSHTYLQLRFQPAAVLKEAPELRRIERRLLPSVRHGTDEWFDSIALNVLKPEVPGSVKVAVAQVSVPPDIRDRARTGLSGRTAGTCRLAGRAAATVLK
jgi:hypothetical protein